MKSFAKRAAQYALRHAKKNKRGEVVGVDFAKTFLIGLVGLVIVGILAYIIVTQLGNTSVVNGSNTTKAIVNNFSTGISQLFSQMPTIFVLLGIVLVVIVAVIAIRVFGGSSGGLAG